MKWGGIVYTYNNKNVLGIGGFKSYFGLWFFNGVFLKDSLNILVSGNETTKALRQWRFNSFEELDEKKILEYISEAIELEKEGKMPGTKTLIETLDKVKARHIKLMWIQPQYSLRKFKGILKDYDLKVAIADPLEPELESNILKIAQGWAEEISKRAP